jgi:Fe2+ or Zn2+ uptake regulation protein
MPHRTLPNPKNILSSEEIRELFKSRGLRITRQREELFQLLLQRPAQHPSAEELFKLIRAADPGISLATVYNTLEALSEAQLIRKIATPVGRARFDSVMEPHAHMVTADGFVFDVPRDLSDAVFEEIAKKISPQLERRMSVKIDRAAIKFLTPALGSQIVMPR